MKKSLENSFSISECYLEFVLVQIWRCTQSYVHHLMLHVTTSLCVA